MRPSWPTSPKNPPMPKRNVELLEKTITFIADHPEQHEQDVWISECGTTACFAGWALRLNGVASTEIARLSNSFDYLYEGLGIRAKAGRALGLTREETHTLFSGKNSFSALQLMVKDLVNGDQLQNRDYYAHLAGDEEMDEA